MVDGRGRALATRVTPGRAADAEQWRGLVTRYDKLGVSHQATADIAESLDWLRAVPDRIS